MKKNKPIPNMDDEEDFKRNNIEECLAPAFVQSQKE